MSIITSVLDVIGSDKTRTSAFLAELDPDDDTQQVPGSIRKFQYYPETVSDSRGVEYQSKNIVGSSHPIYQWVHGSERRISFEAVFTADYSSVDVNNAPHTDGSFLDSAETVSSFVKNPVASAVSLLKGKSEDNGAVDVAAAIAWLRSKTYPLYEKNSPVVAPPKLLLWLENSGITSFVGSYNVDVIPVLLARCDVSYESFFRNGRPRIAVVSLEFFETIQVGSAWTYVSRGNVEKAWTKNYTLGANRGQAAGNGAAIKGTSLADATDSPDLGTVGNNLLGIGGG